MGKLKENLFRLLSPIVFTFVFCLLINSAFGQFDRFGYVVNKNDARLSTEGFVKIWKHGISHELRASDVSASSKAELRKHKKYDPNELIFKAAGRVQPSRPYEKSFWKSKPLDLAKKCRECGGVSHPLMQTNVQVGSLIISSSRKNPRNLLAKRRSRNIKLIRRNRRQAAAAPNQTEAAAAIDDEDGEDTDFVAHARPKPTPQPAKNEQYAVQKSETGQSQSQQSGAAKQDNMNYNPDGSVKSHDLGSSNTNKQETSQFQRSESMIPIAGALSADAILGKNENGTQNSLFGAMQLAPLAPMPQMQPFQMASVARRRKKNRNGSSSGNRAVGANDDLDVI